jgi:hypothetical protein
MTSLFLVFLLWGPPPLVSLDQVKAEQNPEHRARLAVDYAAIAERNAGVAYAKGDLDTTSAELKNVQESLEIARESFVSSHKTPGRNPGPYKYAEMRSRELLIRLGDLERKMDASERDLIAGVKSKVQEIHDAWFEGIMGKKK